MIMLLRIMIWISRRIQLLSDIIMNQIRTMKQAVN